MSGRRRAHPKRRQENSFDFSFSDMSDDYDVNVLVVYLF